MLTPSMTKFLYPKEISLSLSLFCKHKVGTCISTTKLGCIRSSKVRYRAKSQVLGTLGKVRYPT